MITSKLDEEESRIDDWLEKVGISRLSEWDALVFHYRHGTSLASAEQIASLLGYSRSVAGKAMDKLVALGFVQRSRSSQAVRSYRFALPSNAETRKSVEGLIALSETRCGRVKTAGRIRERARLSKASARRGLHIA